MSPYAPLCARCCKRYEGKCLADTEGYLCCGESCHMMKDCPRLRSQIEKVSKLSLLVGVDPLKKNKFYALQSRKGQD